MILLRYFELFLVKVAVLLITAYQHTLSPDHGPVHRPTCRFTPTCSEYTKESIQKFGLIGIYMGANRIMRCNPVATKVGTFEPVPKTYRIGKFVFNQKFGVGSAESES